jgi:hypothetical protein
MVTLEVDDRPSLVIEPFVFAKAKWEVQGSEETGDFQVKGIPGTWDVPHFRQLEPMAHALVCCPNCHQVSVLLKQVTRISNLGELDPSFICKYVDPEGRRCEFHRDAYLDEWHHGKFLYAVSYHCHSGIKIVYTHGSNVAEVRSYFPHIQAKSIIAIGRAIGFAGKYVDAQTLVNSEKLS